MSVSRRGFITGLISFVAAPAIVRATSIMTVKALSDDEVLIQRVAESNAAMMQAMSENLYGDLPIGKLPDPEILREELTAIVRRAFLPRYAERIYLEAPLFRSYALLSEERQLQ